MSDIYQWLYDFYALPQLEGLELAVPRALDEDCSWLLDFLPKLDNPVS